MKKQKLIKSVFLFSAVLLGTVVSQDVVKADTISPAETTSVSSSDASLSTTTKSSTTDSSTTATSTDDSSDVKGTVGGSQVNNVSNVSPEDNYYYGENGSWISSTNVDPDSFAGTIADANKSIDDKTYNAFMDYVNGNEKTSDANINKAVEYYNYLVNTPINNDTASNGLAAEVKAISNLQNIGELSNMLYAYYKEGYVLPFDVDIARDQNDYTRYALYMKGIGPLLTSADGSDDETLQQYQNNIGQILTSLGYSFSDIEDIITSTKKFDELLIKIQNPSDLNEYEDQDSEGDTYSGYTQYSGEDFSKLSTYLDFDSFFNELIGGVPDHLYIENPSYFYSLNQILTPDNFSYLRDWMLTAQIIQRAFYLNSFANEYASDKSTETDHSKFAYFLTSYAFNDAFSQHFGSKFTTNAQINAVTDMTQNIMDSYSDAISNSSWMSDETKSAALDKLNNISVNVGYPKQDFSYFSKYSIDSAKSVYENTVDLATLSRMNKFNNYYSPVDRSDWGGNSSLSSNAMYSRQSNSIFIFAGIMNSPFFDVNQDASKNYGGLGTVIGHELSHAFDSKGSMYDENGIENNWWTASDKAAYNKIVQAMENEFEGLQDQGLTVSGVNTVDENLADNGGLSVAYEAASKVDGFDAKEFFENYASVNKSKEGSNYVLATINDVHAPSVYRVNVNLQNLDAFYDTYGITPKDGMWLNNDQRVKLWEV
ncbi:M13 family metallopeptidase [Lactobacillus terrae]|uniref:M13 family metallopeptidase n=1 Tax=Lactobacillus terrae TaxID=2269374 RepID=UPI001474EA44|nr:M13 family metallopeptidase [Lactobacillus terrae]